MQDVDGARWVREVEQRSPEFPSATGRCGSRYNRLGLTWDHYLSEMVFKRALHLRNPSFWESGHIGEREIAAQEFSQGLSKCWFRGCAIKVYQSP
jgi:hypothetical protein